ncbi:MAG: translation initiation factor IF-2 [Clostridiales bacterium]|nr:translation initiation factor IF-2 [Clostridiales bacterium]
MKVKELADELNMSPKDVLDKAQSMGVKVSAVTDEMSDMDATAVRNTITKGGGKRETKVVKVTPKKSGAEDHVGASNVTVKAANIKMPEIKKSTKAAAKNTSKSKTAKPPVGKPIVSKEIENRPKPAPGQPVVSKEVLERRPAGEKAEEAKSGQKADAVRNAAAEAEAKKAAETVKEAPKAAAPAEEPKKEEPKRRSGLKVIKKAEDVRREEAEAAEKRRISAEKRAAAKAAKEEGNKADKKQGSDRKPRGEKAERGERGDRKPRGDRGERQDKGERSGERNSRPQRRNDNVAAADVAPEKSSTRREKKKDNKDHDKFSKLERGKKQGKKEAPRSLEKQASKKRHANRPKVDKEPEIEETVLPSGTVLINVPITVAGFSEQTKTTVSQIIMTLMKMGVMANVNQNLDEETVVLLAEEMGIQVAIGKVEEEVSEEGIETFDDKEEDLQPRPPIITVMGHVDHGKTSLLDAIRNTNVTAGESGGITQHIGASEVEINGQKIVFLDTPGHEAFTAMRARGAHSTDIAVLVVAADDSVKPQTIESISHAKSAGVPIIVAINKMDKPGANPDIVKKDLAEQGVLVEDWGGDVISVPVSAKTGEGITNLLEMILLQAEVLELKANPDRLAMGTVLEARLDKAKGPVASLLVLNGTLKSGRSIVAGTCSGKIRLMTNDKGEKINSAGPATAVEVLGLTDVPQAGDIFNAVKNDKQAREIANNRLEKQREEVLARNSSTTLEELFSQIQEGDVKDLNLIVKADVQGSVGAIVSSLEKLSNEQVRVKIVHTGVGTVNESDIMLAGTSNAVIIGFNVRPSAAVTSMADRDGIQIRTYRVIYDIIDDVENAMKGMLDPEFREVVLGTVEIRTTFKVPGVGIIGGAYVTSGKVVRNEQIRLVRDGIVIHEGKISSLKRFKDDVKEVNTGYECGIGIEKYNDIKEGDVIECFKMEEIERA